MSANEKMVMVPRQWAQQTVSAGPGEYLSRSDIDLLSEALNRPSQQGQGEPVAWMDPRSPRMHATISNEVKQHNVKFGGAPASAVNGYTIPLYTHADPAEVEQLRTNLDMARRERNNYLGWCRDARGEAIKLRAQLAEAQAENERLKQGFYQKVTDADLKKISDYVSDPGLPTGAFLRQDAYDLANFTEHMCREVQASRINLAEAQALLRQANGLISLSVERLPKKHQTIREHAKQFRSSIESALSASAEPSVPVEIDERAEFENWGKTLFYVACFERDDADSYVGRGLQGAWLGWQARAALERKP